MKNILVFLCLALSLTACKELGNLTGASKTEATKQAKAWAKEMGLNVTKISCAGSDSDGDGYVSCSFNIDGKIQSFECAGSYNLNQGCRTPKVHVGRK